MPDKFRAFVMDVVSSERGVRQCGGKMRPYERATWVCKLSCGHTVERLKSKTPTIGPPHRAKCLECVEQVDAQA